MVKPDVVVDSNICFVRPPVRIRVFINHGTRHILLFQRPWLALPPVLLDGYTLHLYMS